MQSCCIEVTLHCNQVITKLNLISWQNSLCKSKINCLWTRIDTNCKVYNFNKVNNRQNHSILFNIMVNLKDFILHIYVATVAFITAKQKCISKNLAQLDQHRQSFRFSILQWHQTGDWAKHSHFMHSYTLMHFCMFT